MRFFFFFFFLEYIKRVAASRFVECRKKRSVVPNRKKIKTKFRETNEIDPQGVRVEGTFEDNKNKFSFSFEWPFNSFTYILLCRLSRSLWLSLLFPTFTKTRAFSY